MKFIRYIVYVVVGLLSTTTLAQDPYKKTGWASYYHDKFEGRKTSSGERFRQKKMTCAHRTLPFGTQLRVTNLTNNKTVVVTVNDRGPYSKGRIIDLTKAAAKKLDFIKQGHTKVEIEEIVPVDTATAPDTMAITKTADTLDIRYINESTTDSLFGFSVQLGRFSANDDVTRIAARVNRELERQLLVQTKTIEGKQSFIVSVGIFGNQAQAFEYLDKILPYYPGSFIIYINYRPGRN